MSISIRTEAGRDPYDRALSDLVGVLSTRGEDFRTRSAAHDVRLHRTGIKQFHHPVVGDLDLNFETMQLTADPGLTMTLLSSWTAHTVSAVGSGAGALPLVAITPAVLRPPIAIRSPAATYINCCDDWVSTSNGYALTESFMRPMPIRSRSR